MRRLRLFVLSAIVIAVAAVAFGEADLPTPTGPEKTTPTGGSTEAAGSAPDAPSTTGGSTYEAAWTLPTRQLVSAPVEAGGKVVAYTARDGRLSLIVVDPSTGEVVARRPSSSSYVTPGVTMAVAARGDLVYHYRPTGQLQEARVEVYDVRRDRVVARSTPEYFWSLPTGCDRTDGGPVCVTAGDDDPASVYRVRPRSGQLRLAAAGVGRGLDAGLYDDSDTIALVRADRSLWERSAPAMFGGRAVTPAEGWDWQHHGSLLIGSFGAKEQRSDGVWIKRPGNTARIDPRTGRTLWMRPGTAYCELDLMEPADRESRRWFRCATHGRATAAAGGSYDLSTWRTTITRFDPLTGEPLWSTRPASWDTIYDGSTWVKLSGTLVAGRRGGALVTLDVASGQVTKADPDAVGWCAQKRSYRDRDSYARPQTRIARGLASPCRATGESVPTPTFVDPVFGVRVGTIFVWASTTGLHAVRMG